MWGAWRLSQHQINWAQSDIRGKGWFAQDISLPTIYLFSNSYAITTAEKHQGNILDIHGCNLFIFLISQTASWSTVRPGVYKKQKQNKIPSPSPPTRQEHKNCCYTAILNHNEPIYIYTFTFTYTFSYFGGLQILWTRLLVKMLRGISSKRQKHTILHT